MILTFLRFSAARRFFGGKGLLELEDDDEVDDGRTDVGEQRRHDSYPSKEELHKTHSDR